MNKLLHKLSTLVLIMFFSAGLALCAPEDTILPVQQESVLQEQVQEPEAIRQQEIEKLNEEMGLGEQKNIVVEDIKSTPNDNLALTKKVVPDTKSELVKMVFMFLRVMLAVALSSVVIFIMLLVVRRFYSPKVTLDDLNLKEENKNISLDTPQNKSAALKTFLDKTKGM